MNYDIRTNEGLYTLTGAAILGATTHLTIWHSGGYLTPHSPLIATMAAGIFAAGQHFGTSKTKSLGGIGLCLLGSLLASEVYNFQSTAEITVAARVDQAGPLRDLQNKHDAAKAAVDKLENEGPSSERIDAAKQAIAAARATGESQRIKIAQEAIKTAQQRLDAKCLRNCEGRAAAVTRAKADLQTALKEEAKDRSTAVATAESALVAAIAAAETTHAAKLEKARADLKANPAPRSATPLADNLGWAPWAMDLLAAALRAFGGNGLAATLIALGARRPEKEFAFAGQSDIAPAAPANDTGKSDNTDKPGPGNDDPKPRGRRGRRSDAAVVNFSDRFREKHGRSPSGSEIRAAFPEMKRSTAYDYAGRSRIAG